MATRALARVKCPLTGHRGPRKPQAQHGHPDPIPPMTSGDQTKRSTTERENAMQHGESTRKPSHIRTIGIATAGLVLAGTVGITIAGMTTASAAESSSADKLPTQEDPSFVTRGHADGTEAESQARANNLAVLKAKEVCYRAGFESYAPSDADVIEEDDGITVVVRGDCTDPWPQVP